MAKFATYASGAIWWPILQLMQVAQPVAEFVTDASGASWWPNLEPMLVSFLLLAEEITQVK